MTEHWLIKVQTSLFSKDTQNLVGAKILVLALNHSSFDALIRRAGSGSPLCSLYIYIYIYIYIYMCDWILENRPKCHIGPIPFYWPS